MFLFFPVNLSCVNFIISPSTRTENTCGRRKYFLVHENIVWSYLSKVRENLFIWSTETYLLGVLVKGRLCNLKSALVA